MVNISFDFQIYLAFAGIFVIGVAVGVAYGLGSAFQMKKTGVHDVLAFLLLGKIALL